MVKRVELRFLPAGKIEVIEDDVRLGVFYPKAIAKVLLDFLKIDPSDLL